MIAFACPSCRKQLQVKDEFAGKRGSCPHCKQGVVVPAAAVDFTSHMSGESSVSSGVDNPLDFLAPPQAPGELGRLGRYRVLKVLGAGGMGMVLQAEDPDLNRLVALKVMRPELAARGTHRQRFLREARATAAVEHPNIVHLHQVGEDRGVPYLAMPFLKGEPLDARLKREGKLPVAEAVRIARQVAEGLSAAHEHGLIHRDIKPANLWLEEKTRLVKILDFGLVQRTGEDVQLTATGTILGTPAYMAPEQGKSDGIDCRADLFSLGAVLYRMLTGEQPFKGSDTMALLVALATETPSSVREVNRQVPRALSELVMQLLEKDPAKRPATARALSDALAPFEDDRRTAGPSGALPQPRSPRRVGMFIAGGMVLVLLGPALWLAFRSSAPPATAPEDRKVVEAIPSTPRTTEPEHVLTNSINMKLVYVRPGEFLMGSPEDESQSDQGEGPPHRVRITKPFYLGIYEVKQSEYEKVMSSNPARFRDPDNPIESVNWADAMAFCKKLSELAAEKKAGRVYRLPTEAEWEYACRAGTRTPIAFGTTLSSEQANFDGTNPYQGGAKGPNLEKTVKVGSYKPNAWGLHDMHGNVWEWCLDGPRPYVKSDKVLDDPRGPMSPDSKRMIRGGCWNQPGWHCRSALRAPNLPEQRTADVGFRVLLER